MKKSKFLYSLPFKLLVSVALGMGFGLLLNFNSESAFTTAALNVIVTLKYILGQLINFCVPLIIIGFIAPSITQLGNNASRMLGIAVFIAYFSSLGGSFILYSCRLPADSTFIYPLQCRQPEKSS